MNPDNVEQMFLFLAILGAITFGLTWFFAHRKPPSHKPR